MTARLAILALAAFVAGCAAVPPPAKPARAMRIVSLDYCADQYVLRFVDRERILAVSPDATRDFSYMRASAAGVPNVRPRIEDVLLLKPDLVVRSYGGGADAAGALARAGIPVLQLGYTSDLTQVRDELVRVTDELGEAERGEKVAREFDRRRAALPAPEQRRSMLYLTPGGVTTGPGSLIDEMIRASGHENFVVRPGWQPLPLEAMAYARPDSVATARFGGPNAPRDPWSAASHPILRRELRGRPRVAIDGAATACGGWFVMDAIEAMARI